MGRLVDQAARFIIVKMVASRRASMVLPDPGVPIISRWWLPAAVTIQRAPDLLLALHAAQVLPVFRGLLKERLGHSSWPWILIRWRPSIFPWNNRPDL